ncbi:MAG: hypothetical protein ACR2G7_03725 [Acidimicrobiales bacterium]
MAGVQVTFSAMSRQAALEAAQACRGSRDRGFHRTCYRKLPVLDPIA